MRIGIIGPMDEEVALLQAAFTIKETQTIGGRTYQVGTYHDHEVVLVKSGIGKVCAATAATVLINTFKVDAVVNSGCAGSISDKLQIGDLVLSDKLAYQDFDLTIFNYKKGQVPEYEQYFIADHALVAKAEAVAAKLKQEGQLKQPGNALPTIVTGTILTGDQFISQKAQSLAMKEFFPEACMVEMEGAAVAQVCTDFKIPFLVIRSASDTASGTSPDDFEKFVQLAADNSAKLLLGLIDAL